MKRVLLKTAILAAILAVVILSGCNTPADAWVAAANTYIATVQTVTDLAAADLVTLEQAEEFEMARAVADGALNVWAAAIITDGDPAAAMEEFRRAIIIMIARQYAADRKRPAATPTPGPVGPITVDIPQTLQMMRTP
ncbi:MAG: hypothetical protein IMZ55_04930 [Acidobacteria bacterium]|nr:hypothetical protein [Acidobacteriota bacterium]